jgi:hypothetical protein
MPKTVKAKLLLGWMERQEAMDALNGCIFDERLTKKQRIKLWKDYRDKVAALEPRDPGILPTLPFTEVEQRAIDEHVKRIKATPNGKYFSEIVKVCVGNLVARQFHVLTERSERYAQDMQSEAARLNNCFGVGLQFNGQLVFRQVGTNRFHVDLPHPEFVIIPSQIGLQTQFKFQERDRYTLGIRTPTGRLVLWGGYHRTHAVLCHMAGDAAAVAPPLTVMMGIPEVEVFFNRPSLLRNSVLGDRPALLRDFLDEDLFIRVNLRKRRAQGRIEQVRPGRFRCGISLINDDT